MIPRVLMVSSDLDGPSLGDPGAADVERALVPDGETALDRLRREPFDSVLVDLRLEPIDSWCVLAAVGSWAVRPRLVAIVGARTDIGRALILGADLCVAAGTHLHARALSRSTTETPGATSGSGREMPKETECPQPPRISSPTTRRAGASA